jgi:hypothetical protein
MQLFVVDLKNQPGELAHLGESLGQRGVNIELGGVTAGDHGLIYLTASDEDAARAALDAASLSYRENAAIQIKCADRPGEAGQLARKLADANINIEGMLPISICGGEAIFATVVDRPDEARRVLGDQIAG